ncbi:MAG: hypothetical protein AAB588_03330 [Patescibacteria group bacterium]
MKTQKVALSERTTILASPRRLGLAFTLLEIVIVIGIILLLATLGIGSYSAARRSLTIDLETDKLVQLVSSLREISKTSPQCAGIRFETNRPSQKIVYAYKNSVEGCEKNGILTPTNGSSEVTITGIQQGTVIVKTASLLFTPPLGTLQIQPTAENLSITLALKNSPTVRRTISFELTTGKIEKIIERP